MDVMGATRIGMADARQERSAAGRGAEDNALLAALATTDRATLAPWMRRVSLRAGDTLFEPGREIADLHFPLSGAIARVALAQDGRSVHTAIVGREGVSDTLSYAIRCRATVRAVVQAPGEAWRIEANRIRHLVSDRPAVRAVFDHYVCSTMETLERTAAGAALNRIDARLAAWLLQAHDRADGDTLPLTQEQMAGMLGAQRTTVTQIAGGLQASGAIEYRRGKVRVLDRSMLRRLAADGYAVADGRG